MSVAPHRFGYGVALSHDDRMIYFSLVTTEADIWLNTLERSITTQRWQSHDETLMIQTELDILRDVSLRLNSAGIAFMLTGSVAMNYYAQPRMTRDIDLVVALTAPDAETIVRLFELDYYVSPEAIVNAISRRSVFNLIHHESVIKVDCIVLKNEPFRQEEFGRRRRSRPARRARRRCSCACRTVESQSQCYETPDDRNPPLIYDSFSCIDESDGFGKMRRTRR